MRTYVLAVQVDDDSPLFEVIDKIDIGDVNLEKYERWHNGFSNGNVTVIKNGGLERVTLGSFWDGNSLIINESGEDLKHYSKENTLLLLSNNYVFAGLNLSQEEYFRGKFEAAAESNLIGLDVTDMENIEVGSVWNGTGFIS